jgi:ferredoxin-fold anticodon binding domain-containing protein
MYFYFAKDISCSHIYVRHVRVLTVKDLDPTYILFHLINIYSSPTLVKVIVSIPPVLVSS